MNQFINWGEESPEQLEQRRRLEEEHREFAINRMLIEARQLANQAASAGVGGGNSPTTTTTTTVAPTTTTTTSAPTTTTTTHVPGVDFTIEYFIKFNSFQSSAGTYHPRPYSLGAFPAKNAISIESNGHHIWWWAGGQSKIDAAVSLTTGTWYHIAVTRNNGTLSLYLDGTRLGTASYGGAMVATGADLWIGAEPQNSPPLPVYQSEVNGNITNFRWTAACLYSGASFTRPSSPLTAEADTKFLMLATDSGSQLTDSSTFGRTITKVGSPTWSSASPFGSGGGSIAFSGNGQYLTVPASSDWSL